MKYISCLNSPTGSIPVRGSSDYLCKKNRKKPSGLGALYDGGKMGKLKPSIAALAICWTFSYLLAATYYVSPSGSNTAAGNSNAPFKTIQKAADIVKPGDRVVVKAGIYHERVTIRTSGTAASPIMFEAEQGPKGEWKTIVDGSEPVTSWQRATELSPLVYKTTQIKYNPGCMVADGNKGIPKFHVGSRDYKKFIVKAPDDKTGAHNICYWDGIGGFFVFANNTLYVRFKNGENPLTRKVRASPPKPGFLLANKQYVTIRGFRIRACQTAVTIIGSNAKYNIVEDCHFMNGQARIAVIQGASYNTVRRCKGEEHGIRKFTRGAYNYSKTKHYHLSVRYNIYSRYKREIGQGGDVNVDRGFDLETSGTGNEIYDCDIFDTQAGIYLGSMQKAKIYRNRIHNCDKGFQVNYKINGVEIFDNTVYDNYFNFRLMSLTNNHPAYEGPRVLYFYRNTFANPHNIGTHIKAHVAGGNTGTYMVSPCEIHMYHNSFAGGLIWMELNRYFHLVKFLEVNNIFSSPQFWFEAGIPGKMDCNWVGGSPGKTPDSTGAPWFGKGNLVRWNRKFWSDSMVTDFSLKPGSEAIDKGIDLSRPFTICGKSYPALPGMQPGYFAGKAPDMGAVEFGKPSEINDRHPRLANWPPPPGPCPLFKVYNIHGQLVKSFRAAPTTLTGDLGAGIYFVQMPGTRGHSAMRSIRLR